jgi:ubiquitin related modifier 1
MLFSDQRKHSLQIPAKDDNGNAVTVGWLVHHLCEDVMKDTRKEMFVLDGHVYAPILLHRFSAFPIIKSMPSTFQYLKQ